MALNDGVDISGTVRERAARVLRDRILTGALPAGTRLDLDAITKEFATSRTPVREALLELSYDGLVRVAPRSGITVIGMSPEDVVDSFTILGVLTGQAAAWAARRVTDEGIQRLQALTTDVEAHAGEGGIVDANWQFHREIHRAAHSRRLMAQIRQAVRVVPSTSSRCSPNTSTTRSTSIRRWCRHWPTVMPTKPVTSPSDTCWMRAARWPNGWSRTPGRVLRPILCDRGTHLVHPAYRDFHEARIRPAGSDFAAQRRFGAGRSRHGCRHRPGIQIRAISVVPRASDAE